MEVSHSNSENTPVDNSTSVAMTVERDTTPQLPEFQPPIVKAATKEEVFRRLQAEGGNVSRNTNHFYVGPPRNARETEGTAGLANSTPEEQLDQATQKISESALGSLVTTTTHEVAQSSVTKDSTIECGGTSEATVSAVDTKEPGELSDDETPTTSSHLSKHSRRVHQVPRYTWVSNETMLKVKRSIREKEGQYICSRCTGQAHVSEPGCT
jgi:hypothetical protein